MDSYKFRHLSQLLQISSVQSIAADRVSTEQYLPISTEENGWIICWVHSRCDYNSKWI